jgi:hypothetical protein
MAQLPLPKRADDLATLVLTTTGEYLVELLQQGLAAQGLRDSRIIHNISYTISGRNLVSIQIPAYAEWVDKGRRPYGVDAGRIVNTPPPFGAILAWVKRKRIRGRDKRGRFIRDADLAWAIRTAIARKGIKPRPFIEQAIRSADEQLQTYFATSYDIVVDDLLGKLLR